MAGAAKGLDDFIKKLETLQDNVTAVFSGGGADGGVFPKMVESEIDAAMIRSGLQKYRRDAFKKQLKLEIAKTIDGMSLSYASDSEEIYKQNYGDIGNEENSGNAPKLFMEDAVASLNEKIKESSDKMLQNALKESKLI